MDFNVTAARRRLAETDNNISRLETDIRGSALRLNSIREALAADPFNSDSQLTDSPDTELGSDSTLNSQPAAVSGQEGLITLEINRAAIALQNARFGFEIGTLSRNDFLNAENNLKALLYKYEVDADDIERLNIFIGDSDHQNTSVLRGIVFLEPIVLASSRALEAGITVLLKNPEDFFEN